MIRKNQNMYQNQYSIQFITIIHLLNWAWNEIKTWFNIDPNCASSVTYKIEIYESSLIQLKVSPISLDKPQLQFRLARAEFKLQYCYFSLTWNCIEIIVFIFMMPIMMQSWWLTHAISHRCMFLGYVTHVKNMWISLDT